MAKGKNSAALFEVINRGAKPSIGRTRAPSSLLTPKWWFKSSKLAAPAPAAPAPIDSTEPEAIAPPISTDDRPATQIHIDPDRHTIAMQVSFVAAITTGFAVIVAVALAFIIGRHSVHEQQPTAVVKLDQLKQYPPYPNVTNLPRNRDPEIASASTINNEISTPQEKPPTTETTTPGNVAQPNAPQDQQRQVGINYVIVQSYPDEKSAQAACDMLTKNGVPCTVEKGPQGWVPMTWYSVVGTQGFERIRAANYEEYVKSIESLSAKFAGTSKFKKFEPRPYKWKDVR